MNNIFTTEIKSTADAIVARYETKRASILEILRLLQEKHGYITLEMEQAVAEYLEIPAIDVREVMTFYTLFYDKPKAQTRLNVCHTAACSLLGAEDIISHIEKKFGIKSGEMTKDSKFSLQRVECLGACEIAPMMQVNDHEYVGCLTKEKVDELVNAKTR